MKHVGLLYGPCPSFSDFFYRQEQPDAQSDEDTPRGSTMSFYQLNHTAHRISGPLLKQSSVLADVGL